MSINVTVSGNPISIKRGKMVTADPTHAKNEFERRRLMRLEQVRQQSKDIAENVRNKVRKEKKKQMGEMEKEGKEKLKNFQNRKLLELQNQYKEALQELGMGHKQAEELEDEEDILMEQQESREQVAKQRARLAATKMQIQKNEENYKKAMPMQQKKVVRDIENTRSALVCSIKKKKPYEHYNKIKKRKKTSADINITIPDSDSESEEYDTSSETEGLPSIPEEESESESLCDCSADLRKPEDNVKPPENFNGVPDSATTSDEPERQQFNRQFSTEPTTSQNYSDQAEHRMKYRYRNFDKPFDTRISDRIKRREIIASQPDYCDVVAYPSPVPFMESNTQIRNTIEARELNRPHFHYIPMDFDDFGSAESKCTCHKGQKTCSIDCKRKSKEYGFHNNRATRCDSACHDSKKCSCEKIPTKSPSKSNPKQVYSEPLYPEKSNAVVDEDVLSQQKGKGTLREQTEIPTKPPVKLRQVKNSEVFSEPLYPEKSNAMVDEEVLTQQKGKGTLRKQTEIPAKPLVKLKQVKNSEVFSEHKSNAMVNEGVLTQQKGKGTLRKQTEIPAKPLVKLRHSEVVSEPLYPEKSNAIVEEGVSTQQIGKGTLRKQTEIPAKPLVKLRQLKNSETSQKPTTSSYKSQHYNNSNLSNVNTGMPRRASPNLFSDKVSHYDHPNRFQSDIHLPSSSHVERITTDSLEVIPNEVSEGEWHEKMLKRDKDAQVRGRKALEKERIHRDYQEMMKQLPLLDKKQRINQMGSDKPEYHMSEERLKELERKRQNNLDNAFAKAFPNLKPAIVTLPSKNHKVEPPESNNSSHNVNLGEWDVDYETPKLFSAEEVQEIVTAFTGQKPEDRQAKLKELLRSLKLQKDQLLEEIKSLPKDDSVNALINDLNSFSDSDGKQGSRQRKDKHERKRRYEENENVSSTESTTSFESNQEKEVKSKEKDRHRRKHVHGKTPSPRKKAKKSRHKVLVLQNMSTQTTPKTVKDNENKNLPEKLLCSQAHVLCDCNKENEKESNEEVCQILIKLKDNENPEVVVKQGDKQPEASKVDSAASPVEKMGKQSPRKRGEKSIETKSVITETESRSKEKGRIETETTKEDIKKGSTSQRVDKEPRKDRIAKKDRAEPKATRKPLKHTKTPSWREQLSKNTITSSSTSYFSPPEFSKTKESSVVSSGNASSSKESFYNLHKKPRQANVHEFSAVGESHSLILDESMDPRLLNYIKKLLNMSKVTIDELGVSSSDVQTPSQSVIEIESNNPMAQLHNVIKYFNLKAEDIAKELSYSPDVSAVHYNTSASSEHTHHRPQERSDDGSKTMIPDKDKSTGGSKESISCQYACITDSCSKRIATLSAMLLQLREEKIKMLQSPPAGHVSENAKVASPVLSEKDSTAYSELPVMGEKSKESSQHSSFVSLDEEELNRKLLEIDLNLANKLRIFSPVKDEADDTDKLETPPARNHATPDEQLDNADQEFMSRLQRLMDNHPQTQPSLPQQSNDQVPFVPLLMDIPRLPKLDAPPPNYGESDGFSNGSTGHNRPPPSKGLSVAKKFNGDISLIPHELSTIIEADSQLSTKIASANNSKTSFTPRKSNGIELVLRKSSEGKRIKSSSDSSKTDKSVADLSHDISVSIQKKTADASSGVKAPEKSSTLDSSDTSKSKSCNNSTCTKKSKYSPLTSSGSSDDLQAIEAMLRSIGMEWAIPTLHKTQEALALTTSSSSLELSAKRKSKNSSSSGSDVSLKDFLKKQMFSKISSSTFKTDASPSSLLEFSDLSDIQANSSAKKGTQRTSTPITAGKQKAGFTGESDISSVRENSEKLSFHTVSDHSVSK